MMLLASSKGLESYLVALISLKFAAADIVGSTYVLDTVYEGETFFDNFDFTTTSDPTHGFVNYVSQSEAQELGLISTDSTYGAYMGVDHTSTLDSTGIGRNSVRITSKDTFTHGLIISDITHQPGGICGTWPAHWTLGPNWPSTGEIDIIEGVNSQTDNVMSLHTDGSCTIAGDPHYQTGTTQTLDCNVYETGNVGCGTTSSSSSSYGSSFNGVHGGVYATQWTSDYIRIWYFPRDSIPSDIQQQTPDPSGWGLPQANFQGSCDIDEHFQNQKIIFDTTFCGDLAGNLWTKDAVCAPLATTCVDYVAANPAAFEQAYWAVNSVKVYQLQASNSVAPVSSSSIVTPPSAANSVNPTLPTAVVGASLPIGLGMGTSTASSDSAITPTSSLIFPTQTAASIDPYIIDTFFYLGCLSSSLGFPTFHKVSESLFMTPTLCVSQCGDFSYAGIYSSQCFCANELDLSTSQGNGTCDIPCSGNINQVCGGVAGLTNSTVGASNITISSRFARRQTGPLTSGILLTTYENLVPEVVGGAVGSFISPPTPSPSPTILPGSIVTIILAPGPNYTSPIPTSSLVLPAETGGVHYAPTGGLSTVGASALTTIVPPANPSIIGLGMGGAFQITDVVVTTYTDVCPTGLVVITTTSTITHCSCLDYLSSSAPPSIPMITTVKLCTACGSSSQSVTITIPQPGPSSIYISATATAAYPAPTQILPVNGPPAAVQQIGTSNPAGNTVGVTVGVTVGTPVSPVLYPPSPLQAEVYNPSGNAAGTPVPSAIQPSVPISSSTNSMVKIYSTVTVVPVAYITPGPNSNTGNGLTGGGNGIIVGYAHANGSVTTNSSTVVPLAYTGGAEKDSLEIGLVGSFVVILGMGWILM